MTATTQLQPHEAIWTLTNAVVASRCLHVVAGLGVADHVGEEAITVDELAARCGATSSSTSPSASPQSSFSRNAKSST